MRRLVSCHHLAGIGENGCSEQTKCINTCVGEEYEEEKIVEKLIRKLKMFFFLNNFYLLKKKTNPFDFDGDGYHLAKM